jgi:hypothetical protein
MLSFLRKDLGKKLAWAQIRTYEGKINVIYCFSLQYHNFYLFLGGMALQT